MSNASYNATITKKEWIIILSIGAVAAVIVFFLIFKDSPDIFFHSNTILNNKGLTVGEYIAERELTSRIPVTPEEKNQVRKFIVESDSEPAAMSGDILKKYGTRPDNQLFILFTDKKRP
jgi:hypothetical protein